MYAAAGEVERVGAEWGLCYRDSSPTGGLKSESPMPTYSQRPRSQGKSQTPFATPLTTRPPSLSRAEHQLPRELDVVDLLACAASLTPRSV